MKPSHVFLTIALIAGGLFLYHTFVGAPAPAPVADPYDHLDDDDLGVLPEEADPTTLDGGAGEALARRNAETIATLQRELARLRATLARSTAAGPDRPRATGKDDGQPSFDDLGAIDEDDPIFDEGTLSTLQAYMDEIARRKTEARNRTRLEGELTRLGVDLTEEQRRSVVEATIEYQRRSRALMQQGWPTDEAGRAARKEAFGKLKDEYVATVNTLVPASEAEKITSSRISRSYGTFFGGDNRIGRPGRGNRRTKR